MSDLIDRDFIKSLGGKCIAYRDEKTNELFPIIGIDALPSAQPEPTEYIPDTKAVPSRSDCVCLSERVSTTFYDDEHEEWSQKTVTI